MGRRQVYTTLGIKIYVPSASIYVRYHNFTTSMVLLRPLTNELLQNRSQNFSTGKSIIAYQTFSTMHEGAFTNHSLPCAREAAHISANACIRSVTLQECH